MMIYAYDPRVKSLLRVPSNETVLLRGSFCSWQYVTPVANLLRRELIFHPSLGRFAARFLADRVPAGWNATPFVRVGVHVRRGDFLLRYRVAMGFTVAPASYLRRALSYFVRQFKRVQFVVASNDIRWCQGNISPPDWAPDRVNVTFSTGHTAGEDFALLASCNHTIITTGTYGWWAAWFVNGITLYYSKFPRPGSSLGKRSRVNEYYPPNWIGIGD